MEIYRVDAVHPNPRYMNKTVEVLKGGGLIAYPTDVNYGLGCMLGSPAGVKNLNVLTKKLGRNKLHTLICRDFSDIGKYAIVPNNVFRAIKKIMPGPYTIILEATPLVPRVCQTQRSTIGIRIVNTPVMNALLSELQGPLLNFTALPGDDNKLTEDPKDIAKLYSHTVDALIDIGEMPSKHTTVVDFTSLPPVLVREGEGKIQLLSL